MTWVQIWLARSAMRRADPALARHLDVMMAGLEGEVIELGCGVGGLFGRYPAAVRRLLAVEPADDLRARAAQAARVAPVPVEVVTGPPDGSIPAATGSADFVVCSSVFCSVSDPAALLAEVRRVLRPGGELRLFEHVLAPSRMGRAGQRAADRLGWPRLLGGCHTARDTVRAVEEAGFRWLSLRHLRYVRNPVMRVVGPHILAVAVPR